MIITEDLALFGFIHLEFIKDSNAQYAVWGEGDGWDELGQSFHHLMKKRILKTQLMLTHVEHVGWPTYAFSLTAFLRVNAFVVIKPQAIARSAMEDLNRGHNNPMAAYSRHRKDRPPSSSAFFSFYAMSMATSAPFPSPRLSLT